VKFLQHKIGITIRPFWYTKVSFVSSSLSTVFTSSIITTKNVNTNLIQCTHGSTTRALPCKVQIVITAASQKKLKCYSGKKRKLPTLFLEIGQNQLKIITFAVVGDSFLHDFDQK
jgi:hypothetical protein